MPEKNEIGTSKYPKVVARGSLSHSGNVFRPRGERYARLLRLQGQLQSERCGEKRVISLSHRR